MRNVTLFSLIIGLIFTTHGFAAESKQAHGQSIEQFMQSYLDGYEQYLTAGVQADVASVTSHFSEPLVMMPPSGPVPMANHEAFAPAIANFLEKSLKAKGVVKLVWKNLQIAQLSKTQALVSGLANSLDKAGQIVDQRASIYLLTKNADGWSVAVNLPHSPSSVPMLIAAQSQ